MTTDNRIERSWCQELLANGQTLRPGTYDVTKRFEVATDGKTRWIDCPGGIPISGLWANTDSLIMPVITDQEATA